jgi:hypothetical protein
LIEDRRKRSSDHTGLKKKGNEKAAFSIFKLFLCDNWVPSICRKLLRETLTSDAKLHAAYSCVNFKYHTNTQLMPEEFFDVLKWAFAYLNVWDGKLTHPMALCVWKFLPEEERKKSPMYTMKRKCFLYVHPCSGASAGVRNLSSSNLKRFLKIVLSLLMAVNPLLGIGRFFSFLILCTVDRSPWIGIIPSQGLYLHTEHHKHRIHAST